ncbi:CHASE domain-containing protein [uncultured Paracoccus sp.]|uniref:CHASE domain-containing protein n=1 Tax=uncultured Paracoccus sp. TaxID=189685 RepID=UPI00261B51A7|nr:CHASE domain-containing protein [uncultured Paracoccus sp.]
MNILRQRYLPALVFVVVAFAGLIFTFTAHDLRERATASRFARMADLVAYQIVDLLSSHTALLRATVSYFEASDGRISTDDFGEFVKGLNLTTEYAGVHGMGFAQLTRAEDVPALNDELRRVYGPGVVVFPPIAAELGTPIVLLEPQDARNREALGYDMFSEAHRRAAMERALATNRMSASAPVQLVQEITSDKQQGFLIYAPVRVGGSVVGFIYAPYRATDLHRAALRGLEDLPVRVRTVDTSAPDLPLYEMPVADGKQPSRATTRDITIADRTWRVEVAATPAFDQPTNDLPTVIIGVLAALLALASSSLARLYQRHVDALQQSAELANEVAEQRELLAHEMRHRIKNHIARFQAIVRFTRRNVSDMDEFFTVLNARLMAMGKAQDLITQNAGQFADLKQLVTAELGQISEGADGAASVLGPGVQLNARQSQAMALVIHELTTNAMKYGSSAQGGLSIGVTWSLHDQDGQQRVRLAWRERGDTPTEARTGQGFGTELIDTLVEGDLDGTVDRRFTSEGLAVDLDFALDQATAA